LADPAAQLVSLGKPSAFAVLMGLYVGAALILRDRISAVVALVATPLSLVVTEIIGKIPRGARGKLQLRVSVGPHHGHLHLGCRSGW
jgi:predicted Co/Zn/Cd cation transporter (cation efflux family)